MTTPATAGPSNCPIRYRLTECKELAATSSSLVTMSGTIAVAAGKKKAVAPP
jgi:hypothetical protein